MAKKLTCLMNIRNKFAHVQEVDSFDNLFAVASNGKQIKNQLEGWYSLDEKNEEDDIHKFLFFKLAEEITHMLLMLQVQERVQKNVLKAEEDFIKKHMEAYKEVISGNENFKKIDDEVLQKTIEKLPELNVLKKKLTLNNWLTYFRFLRRQHNQILGISLLLLRLKG